MVWVLAFAGCALTPDYERPELHVPSAYQERALDGESIVNLPWFEIFRDEQLRALIEIALAENKDLDVALARIAESRALVTATRADQFPFIDVFGSAGRGRMSQKVIPGAATRDNLDVSAGLSFEPL